MPKRQFKEIANEIEDKILAGKNEITVRGDEVVVRNDIGVTIGRWLKDNYPHIKVTYS